MIENVNGNFKEASYDMEKILMLKEIFERKIEKWSNNIQRYNDMYNEVEKENRNKSITVSKYEQTGEKQQCKLI